MATTVIPTEILDRLTAGIRTLGDGGVCARDSGNPGDGGGGMSRLVLPAGWELPIWGQKRPAGDGCQPTVIMELSPLKETDDSPVYRHKGACFGCGWLGPDRDDENPAAEDAHDHTHPATPGASASLPVPARLGTASRTDPHLAQSTLYPARPRRRLVRRLLHGPGKKWPRSETRRRSYSDSPLVLTCPYDAPLGIAGVIVGVAMVFDIRGVSTRFDLKWDRRRRQQIGQCAGSIGGVRSRGRGLIFVIVGSILVTLNCRSQSHSRAPCGVTRCCRRRFR